MDTNYNPPAFQNWEGRTSGDRAYMHENISLLDLSEGLISEDIAKRPALIGYACDEGVRRNQGRPGARSGPDALRKALGRMPKLKQMPSLSDAGDVLCVGTEMEAAQEHFASMIRNLVTAGFLPMAIGGGHDIAYGHYLGLRQAIGPELRLGILNFDAHFDLRQPVPLPHSGSPFLQIAEHCSKSQSEFLYGCIGVRQDANPQELWDRAASLDVLIIQKGSLLPGQLQAAFERIRAFVDSLDAVYLTIDLDGFSSAYAPGVSAASPMGYSPESVLPLLDLILSSGKLISMDIAELNPEYDREGQTAMLAASLFHKVLHHPGLF